MVSQGLTDALTLTGVYVIIVFLVLYVINWMTTGFLWQWILVKGSRGKKVLLPVHTSGIVYFRSSVNSTDQLNYKDLKKEGRTITNLQPESFYLCWGVTCVDIDEPNNCVWKRDGSKVVGNDTRTTDHLLERMAMRPLDKQKLIQAIIIVGVLIFVGMCVAGFFGYKSFNSCDQMVNLINQSVVIR